MKKKNTRVLLSFLLAVALEVIAILMFTMTGGTEGAGTINRLGVLFGGNFVNGGYIQFLEYIFFFWGSLEVIYQQRTNKKELSYLNAEVLPEQEHMIIGPTEVNQIRVKVANYLRKKQEEYPDLNFYLVNMIKRVTTKFRANLSIAEAMEIVNTQTQVNLLKAESRQSFIRYTAWAVPTIGFIGTVVGISAALAIADSGDTGLITSTLGIAFDTTLVALILSVLLMWLIHNLQQQTETMHARFQEFVIENLINKIDIG